MREKSSRHLVGQTASHNALRPQGNKHIRFDTSFFYFSSLLAYNRPLRAGRAPELVGGHTVGDENVKPLHGTPGTEATHRSLHSSQDIQGLRFWDGPWTRRTRKLFRIALFIHFHICACTNVNKNWGP